MSKFCKYSWLYRCSANSFDFLKIWERIFPATETNEQKEPECGLKNVKIAH